MAEEVVTVPFKAFSLLPPPPGVCQQCAVDHEPGAPHNRDSLHYQYWFRLTEAKAGREERWPTWADAMAHCEHGLQTAWREELERRGVNVDG